MTLTKTASASPWTVGVPASYTLQVQNTGPVATTAVATITDTIPSGLTIGTLPGNCSSAGQTVTCTIAAGLAASGSTSFVIPVTPTAAAGASVTNTATVSGGGDPACPAAARCTSTAGPTPVQMAVATQLVFGQQPTNTTGGAAITPAPTVRLLDAFGNPTTSTASVTIAIGSNPGGGTLSGTATVAAVAGLASFPGLSIDAAGSGYTFTASSAGLSGATSSAFDVVVGAPAQLAFGQQPTNTAAGAVITPAPTVRILDAGGNLTTSMASISVALGNNPGSATLGGTTTVAASDGIATFPGLTVSNGGTGYTLTASGAGATGTTSAAFNISCPATVVTTSADSGAGSLRQIIADACPGSTITFASSIDTVELSSAEIAVSKPLTIDGGTGVVVTRLAGSPAFRHFLVSASLTLNQLELLGGEASGSFPDGGAIHLSSGTLTLRSCRLSGNAAQLPSGSGGAVFADAGTTLNVLNSLVSGNRADGGFGGGILNRGSLFLINATVAGNFAGTSGGGVSNLGSYSADVRNSILYGNEAPHAPEISANVGFNSVRTIIGIDPLFVERVDASDNAPTTAGDYRLDDFSSAIDSGSNALIPAGVVTDVDGNPRRVDDANEPDSGIGTAPIVDVGAYERQIDSMFGVVEVTPTSLVVSEAGPTSDSFVISLDRAPRSDVTIELSFDANVVVDSGSGFGPSPQTVTLTPANALTGVTVTVQAVDDAIVEASPHFSTIITAVTSSAAPAHNGLMVDDVTVTIADNDVVIDAVDDAGTVANGASGGTAVANVLTNDTLDGGAATLANVTLTQVSTTHPNVSLNAATGALSVAPATAAGSYSVVYQICEQAIPTNCDTANVSVSVGAAVIDAVDDSGTVASGASGGIAVPNVLVNDTLDGSPATLATVSLTQDGTTSPQVTLNPATGEVNVAAATAVGIYVVSYRICEQLNPANCDLATINVDVGAAVIDAVEDSGAVAAGATGGGTAVANVLVNDTLDGSLVVAGEVTLSQVSVSHPNLALNPSSGAVTATAGMPVGSHTLVYQICEMLNPTSCDSATVTVEALAPPALSISSPSQSEGNGGTSTMNFVVSIAAPFALDVGFNASTADGSATTADNDYLALALTPFTISAGQTSVRVPVSINGDTTFEGNESFALNLTDIRSATPGVLTGTGTIEDDDLQSTTTVIDSISPSTTMVGQSYTVAVTVAAQTLSQSGSVSISDGTASCSAPLSAGAVPTSTMSCSLASTTVGMKTLTASFLPDNWAFDASSDTASHAVTAAATTISVTAPARSRINQPTAFSFTLAATAPGAGMPTGSVTLTSGSSSCTATLPATSCDLSFDTLGSRMVTASYAGDANYLASDSGAAGSLQTLVYALADVSISKTDGLATYAPNDLIVYTVQVRNAGPDDAAQIRVQDILPTSLLSVIWFADPASGTGDLDLVLATLPAGAMEDFTIYGRVNGSPDQVVNTATLSLPVDGTVEDPNPGNNSATDVNLLEGLFEDGFESPAVAGPDGSLRLPTAALAPLLDSVARVVYRLDDDHGDVARIYARLDGETVDYALAKRGPDGRWTLGAWQSYAQEPTLTWHAVLVSDRWRVMQVDLR
ncbi:MAG: DUF11 domain-containing protein [Xanthomonadales bacterium]|nr:DUF11 domain-containing protein [Xanthomonadales bacterium]